jgi:hypothetical protein
MISLVHYNLSLYPQKTVIIIWVYRRIQYELVPDCRIPYCRIPYCRLFLKMTKFHIIIFYLKKNIDDVYIFY